MLIGSLASSSGVMQQNIKKTDAKLQLAIASLVSGKRTQDVAELAIATQLQSKTAGLKQVSQSLAQASSFTQVANGAIEQAQAITRRLQEIAVRSNSDAVNDQQRVALNKEFKSLVAELDHVAAKTQFNGKNVLDGSIKGEGALSLSNLLATEEGDDAGLEIDNLATDKLFNGQSLNVLNADAAAKAQEVLGQAQEILARARADVGSFQETLDYAAASIDSAIVNQEAAQSLLADADFLEESTNSQLLLIQRNAQLSLAAQGNRLPSALLQLVS